MSASLEELSEKYKEFMENHSDSPDVAHGRQLLFDVRSAGREIVDEVEREKYAQVARDISERLFELTGEYLPTRLAPLAVLPPNEGQATNRFIPPDLVDPHILDAAKQCFAALPLDTVPDPAPLPPGSRM